MLWKETLKILASIKILKALFLKKNYNEGYKMPFLMLEEFKINLSSKI